MTATTSPKELLANYRAENRAAAQQTGAPLDRSDFPGLYLETTGMIYLNGKRMEYRPVNGIAEPVTPTLIAELLTGELKSTVVSDKDTFARIITMAENLPASDNTALARRLRINRGMNYSVKMPILTEALAARFWLPDSLNETVLEDWKTAFGIMSPTRSMVMTELVDLAMSGSKRVGLGFVKTTNKLEEVERKIMSVAAYPGISSDCWMFSLLQEYGVLSGHLRVLDPGLLEMHMIDGTVSRVVPKDVQSRAFTASVSSPFKLKEGATCVITDGQEKAEVTMESTRYANGVLDVVLSSPSGKGPGVMMVHRAKTGTAPLFMCEAPFLSYGSAMKNKRWLEQSAERVTGRDIPLDVVLAGAPVEA